MGGTVQPVAKRQLSFPLPTTIRESILKLQLPVRSLALSTGDKEGELIESPPDDQGLCIARETWKTYDGPLRLCPLRAQAGFSSWLTNCLRALRMQTAGSENPCYYQRCGLWIGVFPLFPAPAG